MADGREREDARAFAHVGDAGDHHMGQQFDACAQHDIGADHAQRADGDGIGDSRLGIDDSGGMNIGHQSSRIMAA